MQDDCYQNRRHLAFIYTLDRQQNCSIVSQRWLRLCRPSGPPVIHLGGSMFWSLFEQHTQPQMLNESVNVFVQNRKGNVTLVTVCGNLRVI